MALTRLGGANAITGTLPATNINDTSIGNITALPAAILTGSLVLITETNISGTGPFHITNLFSSTYRDYKIIGSGLKQSTDNTNWIFQLRTSSAAVTSGYYWSGVGQRGAGSAVDDGEDSTHDFRICGSVANDTHATNFDMTLYDPYGYQVSKNYTCLASGRRENDTAQVLYSGGFLANDTRMEGIMINVDNGNMTAGNIKVYGIKGS